MNRIKPVSIAERRTILKAHSLLEFRTTLNRRQLMTAVRLAMGDYIPDDHERKLVLGWLFGTPGTELSTRDLTDRQLYALHGWLQIGPAPLLEGQDSNGEWAIGLNAWQELQEMIAMIRGGSIVSAVVEQGGKITHAGQAPKQESYYHFEA